MGTPVPSHSADLRVMGFTSKLVKRKAGGTMQSGSNFSQPHFSLPFTGPGLPREAEIIAMTLTHKGKRPFKTGILEGSASH